MTHLAVWDVRLVLGGAPVLDGVSLAIRRGESVAILGPNGSGKTTLLRLLAGSLTPAAGEVVLDDRPMRAWGSRERARQIAVVPQQAVLPAGFTVADCVAMGRIPWRGFLGQPGAGDRRAVRLALEQTETLHLAARTVETLSGGERQRVLLARALAQQSRVLLLDEPTASLDPGHAASLLALVERLRRECELTVVLVLHDLTLAAAVSSRLVLLNRGRVVADGPADTILSADVLGPVYGAGLRVERLPDGRIVVLTDPGVFLEALAAVHPVAEAPGPA